MDAIAVLQSVAETYANLRSLSVETISADESGDEDAFTRSQRRGRAFFAAPDKVRIEEGGRQGTVFVTKGGDFHTYFAGPKRYSRTTGHRREMLPGWFRPEFPVFGGAPAFLFRGIAEKVLSAQSLREESVWCNGAETPCRVVSVTYEPPAQPALITMGPVTFWVDSVTSLILRLEGEVTHRMPAHDQTHTNKHTVSFVRAARNEPIAPETFEYTPPADALDASDPRGRGGCGSGGGGGGSVSFGPGTGRHIESWHSHDWAGETFVERYKLRWGGTDLTFERRLTFSEDRRELRVFERITGPKGQTERDLSLPVA